jgi:hypothetical protein
MEHFDYSQKYVRFAISNFTEFFYYCEILGCGHPLMECLYR